MGLNIEWTFNVGTIVSLVFAAGIFYAITKSDLKVLKDNIVEIKSALAKQTDIIVQLAIQKERLDNDSKQINQLRDDFNMLRKGQGFVQRDVNGEWPKT